MPVPVRITFIVADNLLPRLKAILANLDALYAATGTHRGTDSRLDQVADGLADLIAELSE